MSAVAGGLLVAMTGVIDAIFGWIYAYHTAVNVWFGWLPWPPFYHFNVRIMGMGSPREDFNLASNIICAVVWIGLGVVIMVASRRHLTAVAVTGFVAVVVLLAIPAAESSSDPAIPVYFNTIFDQTLWLLGHVILIPVAIGLIIFAGRNGRLVIWAVCLLTAACAVSALVAVLNGGWFMVSGLAVGFFAIGWIAALVPHNRPQARVREERA